MNILPLPAYAKEHEGNKRVDSAILAFIPFIGRKQAELIGPTR